MNNKSFLLRTTVLIWVSLLLVACSTSQPTTTPIPLTAKFTSKPPTATFTSVPPTATNTPVPSTATITNTPTPRPSLCEGVEGDCLEIRYEKDNCTHVGPEIVPAGQITLVFSNYANSAVGIDLEKLDEGKTWQAMSNYMRPLPFMGSQPDWSSDVIMVSVPPGDSTKRQEELTLGIYISVCGQSGRPGVWLGGQLIVED